VGSGHKKGRTNRPPLLVLRNGAADYFAIVP